MCVNVRFRSLREVVPRFLNTGRRCVERKDDVKVIYDPHTESLFDEDKDVRTRGQTPPPYHCQTTVL